VAPRLGVSRLTLPLHRNNFTACSRTKVTVLLPSPRHCAISSCDSKQTLGGRSQQEYFFDLGIWRREALDLDKYLGLYSSSNIFWVNELKAKRSIGHVVCIGGSCDRLDVERNIT